MELKLQRNLVLQELSILQGVVEHRTTIPILSSILAEAEESRLRLVATDLDMTIVTACPAVVHGGGRATLESKVFQNLVRNLPEEEFTLRQDGDSVEITCGRFHSRMAVSDPSEYPTVPEVPKAGEYAVQVKFVVDEKEQVVVVPDCGTAMCPMEKFVDLMAKVVPANWRRECGG